MKVHFTEKLNFEIYYNFCFRYLPTKLKKAVEDSLLRNSFYCFPENIMLGMIASEDESVRREGKKRFS